VKPYSIINKTIKDFYKICLFNTQHGPIFFSPDTKKLEVRIFQTDRNWVIQATKLQNYICKNGIAFEGVNI